MAKSSCKCKATECEECPEWIFTFADLVMLMMGFFVILWVLKPAGGGVGAGEAAAKEKWQKTVISIREAFDYIPDPNSTDPIDIEILRGREKTGRAKIEAKGATGTDTEVQSVRTGSQSAVGGRVPFGAGDAALRPEASAVLDELIARIKGHRHILIVKGHTSLDDFKEPPTADQQMDLSLRRAKAVAEYLSAHGVQADVLRVLGCSIFEPVVQRQYTAAAQEMNRRVEIEATTTLVAERQDTHEAASPATPAAPAAHH